MTSSRRRICWLLLAALAGQAPASARAEDASALEPEARELASQHFERGYALAQRADYSAAAIEFRLAYDLHPEPAVLFNLGQAYAASGQPIAAYDAFADFLRGTDERSEPGRRRAAEHLMAVAERQIGRLWIEVEPQGAEIEVDGRAIGKAPLGDFSRLPTGVHSVVVRARDHEMRVLNVTVRPGQDSQIFVRLEPLRVTAPGMLLLTCAVPDVKVWLDGEDRGTIPEVGYVHVPAGAHSLILKRPGYVTESATYQVEPGQSYRHECAGQVDSELDRSQAATLVISEPADWARATLYVDGRVSHAGPMLLPSGLHSIEVRAAHAKPWARTVNFAPGATVSLKPELAPTPEHVSVITEERSQRRLWSTVSLGTGLALMGTAATLSWIGSEKHEAWARERDALNQEDLAAAGVPERLQSNSREALEIQRLEYATWGAAALGTGALALSAYLWFTAVEVPGQGELHAQVRRSGGVIEYTGEF